MAAGKFDIRSPIKPTILNLSQNFNTRVVWLIVNSWECFSRKWIPESFTKFQYIKKFQIIVKRFKN